MVYNIERNLLDYVFNLTAYGQVEMPDSKQAQEMRESNDTKRFPRAGATPSVKLGCTLTGNVYWGGEHEAEWARNWTRYYNHGNECFGVSDMEDTGVAQALRGLHCAGLADISRLLVLRAASDVVMPARAAETNYEFLFGQQGQYDFLVGLPLALNASFAVGSKVVYEVADRHSAIQLVFPKQRQDGLC